jgi:hypothetical protein
MQLMIIDFYSPTDAQVKCLKNNFKIYIKIDIKTAPKSGYNMYRGWTQT